MLKSVACKCKLFFGPPCMHQTHPWSVFKELGEQDQHDIRHIIDEQLTEGSRWTAESIISKNNEKVTQTKILYLVCMQMKTNYLMKYVLLLVLTFVPFLSICEMYVTWCNWCDVSHVSLRLPATVVNIHVSYVNVTCCINDKVFNFKKKKQCGPET